MISRSRTPTTRPPIRIPASGLLTTLLVPIVFFGGCSRSEPGERPTRESATPSEDLTPSDRKVLEVRKDLHDDPLPPGAIARYGTLRFRLDAHTLSFDPTGTRIAAGSRDGRLKVWEVRSGKTELTVLDPEGAPVTALAFSSPDLVVAGSSRGAVKTYRLPEGNVVDSAIFEGEIGGLAITPEGLLVVIAGKKVLLRDPKQGQLLDEKTLAETQISLALSPSGELAFTGDFRGRLRSWNLTGNRLQATGDRSIGDKPLRILEVSPEAETIFAGTSDGTLSGWRPQSESDPTRVGHPKLRSRAGQDPRFATAGNHPRIAAAGRTGEISLWTYDEGNPEIPWKLERSLGSLAGAIQGLEFSPDHSWLAASGGGFVAIWETESWNRRAKNAAGHRGPVSTLAFSQSGTSLATGGADGWIHCWNVENGSPDGKLRRPSPIRDVQWASPEALLIADQEVLILNRRSGETLRTFSRAQGARLAVHPSGSQLAAPLSWGLFGTWDFSTGNFVKSYGKTPLTPVEQLDYTRDGTSLVVSGAKLPAIEVWNPPQTKAVRRWTTHRRGAKVFALSPNAPVLVTAEGPGLGTGEPPSRILFWDLATGERIGGIRLAESFATALLFSRDGRILIGGDTRGRLALWNSETRELLREVKAHEGAIRDLALQPEQNRVASAGDDTTALLWDLEQLAP